MSSHLQTTIQFEGESYTLDERHKMNAQELGCAMGLSLDTICRMKAAGCPFFGRFSSVSIVRKWEFLNPGWRHYGKS